MSAIYKIGRVSSRPDANDLGAENACPLNPFDLIMDFLVLDLHSVWHSINHVLVIGGAHFQISARRGPVHLQHRPGHLFTVAHTIELLGGQYLVEVDRGVRWAYGQVILFRTES